MSEEQAAYGATPQADMAEFRQDARGNLVHVKNIKPLDMARDDLVRSIIPEALALRQALRDFKARVSGDVAAFVDLAFEEYGVKRGGNKGNVSLPTFDGRYKVERVIQERVEFDERIKAAQALVQDCLTEWTSGVSPQVKTIIDAAFQADGNGMLSRAKVLSLLRLTFEDDRWNRAMEAIKDSLRVVDSKTHFKILERQEDGSYRNIPLTLSDA